MHKAFQLSETLETILGTILLKYCATYMYVIAQHFIFVCLQAVGHAHNDNDNITMMEYLCSLGLNARMHALEASLVCNFVCQ